MIRCNGSTMIAGDIVMLGQSERASRSLKGAISI
jgi:hypothetical protein